MFDAMADDVVESFLLLAPVLMSRGGNESNKDLSLSCACMTSYVRQCRNIRTASSSPSVEPLKSALDQVNMLCRLPWALPLPSHLRPPHPTEAHSTTLAADALEATD